MDDKSLFRLSLLVAAAGLIALVFAAQFAEPRQVEISSIDESMVGVAVEVNGTVNSTSIKDGNIFIGLTDGRSRVDVVVFEQDARGNPYVYTLKKGDFVVVQGRVSFYRNSLEIVATDLGRV